MPIKRKNPAKAIRRFANLYVHGPNAGDWAACELAVKAGYSPQDPVVREAIIAEGGIVEAMPVAHVPLDVVEIMADTAETDDDWKALAQDLRTTIIAISKGDVKASASQTAIIKHILDRAYGRATAAAESQRQPAGLLILPTLGERSNMTVCPKCGSNGTS